ncbi:MAG: S1C family serine protease [Gaiellaceae bacterium]
MRPFRTGLLLQSAALVAAAVAGGAVALTGAALLWGFNDGEEGASAVPVAAADRIEAPSSLRREEPLSIREIWERARTGVVQVSTRTTVETQDPFGFNLEPQVQQGLGSGFLIDKEGHIITNYHVVQDVDEGGGDVTVSFSNNENMEAKIVGRDPSTDLALLKVEAESRALRPLELGDSDSVQVGDEVVAIGNPLGYQRTVTAGIVSAVGRAIQAPNTYLIDQVIQTDAAINQGNSGGPLLNAAGRVIGVNTQIATQTGGNIGLGFAVPINTVKDVASQIIRDGRVEHAEIGIAAQPINPEIARLFHLPVSRGLLVSNVYPETGAARAGLKAGTEPVTVGGDTYYLGGDIIVKAEGVAVTSVEQLRQVVSRKDPGDTVELEVVRDGNDESEQIDVELGRQPSSPRG